MVFSDQGNELVIVLTNQTMFRFTGLDFAGLREAISSRNLAKAAELKKKIVFERISLAEGLGTSDFNVCDSSTSSSTSNPQILLGGTGACYCPVFSA